MHTRRRLFHPAGLVLARSGITQREIAERLGVSPTAVSMYLRGDRRQHPDLIDAIRVLAGPETAAEIVMILNGEPVSQ